MSRMMLLPVAVILAAGSVVLGPGEGDPPAPAVEQVQERRAQVDLALSGN